MNKVVTINLNGRSYQIEEGGYEILRKYLDQAAEKLNGNPDKTEIMADFEQAIADKCDARLSPRKNVMSTAEIEEIIKVMGPVDTGKHEDASEKSGTENAAGGAGAQKASPPKRLYRIFEGSIIRGVCTGIAAYANVDVTLVRAVFIILTILTGGGWILAYAILMFVMPVARTADQVAQAHGEPPFTAKDFIDRAKNEYAKFASDSTVSKDEWRENMKNWKREMKEKQRAWRNEWRNEHSMKRDDWQNSYHSSGARVVGGILSAALWILFLIAVWSFLVHGMVFGHVIGTGHPIWITLAFLVLIFWLVSLPFRAMMWNRHRHHDFIWTVVGLIVLFYISSLLFPPVHTAWVNVIGYLERVK